MTYRYLEDIATADIAFEAIGDNLSEVFRAAADATMNVMIENPESIRPEEVRTIRLENSNIEMLLFDLLQELLYYKDAEQMLLRLRDIEVSEQQGLFLLTAAAHGEKLSPERHEQRADVKAVTLHRFTLEQTVDGRWKAMVILDV
jgi:SHS2 domain-containing protein